MSDSRQLRMGMVGGGEGAFIGAVHRAAARFDDEACLVAGAFSSTADKSRASGRALGVADDRAYGSWEEMLARESALPEHERIDFVSIVVPNHLHFPVARAFTDAGIHVICDKPLVHTSAEARQLADLVAARRTVFAVTYNYSGYPLVKQARHLVTSGALGDVRKIVVAYYQGWLTTALEEQGHKQAAWRTDPERAGAGAIGDIGSHAEQLARYVTGSRVRELCADVHTFVPGRRIDDDVSVLLRFDNGARGTLVASQVCTGSENDLQLSVWGTQGRLRWRQEEPNALLVSSTSGVEQIWRRGNDALCDAARNATRLPPGHPEAFHEAFANVYRNAFAAIRADAGGLDAGRTYDFPDVQDGAVGVRFIETTLASGASDRKWTPM